MRLIIAEKPSLGRAIADAISKKCTKGNSCIVCNDADDTTVTWLVGHVLESFQPAEYTEEWKAWSLDKLPLVPDEWKLKPKAENKDIINAVKTLLKTAKIVVNAGDPDREGQLLVDEFLDFYGWKGKTLRLLLKDLTPETIKKSLATMKDNKEQEGLKFAALARQRADWLVGMNASRYYGISARRAGYLGTISIGRVQTPTLGLVVHRDLSIENFKSVNYYVVTADNVLSGDRTLVGTWQPDTKKVELDEEGRLLNKAIAEDMAKRAKGQNTKICHYEKKNASESVPLPYKLSDIQADANRKLNLTLKMTLEVIQSLYEKQVVSYPRSDCNFLPEGLHNDAKYTIESILRVFPLYEDAVEKLVDVKRKSRAWNSSKVAEHYAIIPTGKPANNLTDIEKKMYELICVRYMLMFCPDFEYKAVTVEFKLDDDEKFRCTGREVINLGWKSFSKDMDDDDDKDKKDKDKEANTILPPVKDGETGKVKDAKIVSKETTPPKPFNDGTLVKAMGNVHQFVTDEVIKKQLKEAEGLGTAATQSGIIETLIKRGFIERIKKEVRSTEAGKTLILALEGGTGKQFAYPDMTAVWESQISDVQKKTVTLDAFIKGIVKDMTKIVKDPIDTAPFKRLEGLGAKTGASTGTKGKGTGKKSVGGSGFPPAPKDGEKCLNCKAPMRKCNGQYGEFFACDACNSKFSSKDGKPQPKSSGGGGSYPVPKDGEKCLDCGKPMRKLNGQYGEFFACNACGSKFSCVNGKPVKKTKK